MNPFFNKRIKNKENQFQPAQNKVLNYQNNSNNKKFFSTSNYNSYERLKVNENEIKIYNKTNKNSEEQSFDSVNEQTNYNENNNNNFFEIKLSYNNDNFYNYQYYNPSMNAYKPLPLQKITQKKENINNNNYNTQIPSKNNEYSKYNPNFFNQRKKIVVKKANKNKLTINNISNNNFIPKRAINTINNSKYGQLSKNNFLNEINSSSQYISSFNNNFLNFLSQNNYNEDSFINEDQKEENNNYNNNFQMNRLTRYDIRKKKSLTDGQTFFIKKAENLQNYQFFESKREKKSKPDKIQDKANTSEINTDKENEKNNNYKESIYLENDEKDEVINNHNFIIIKSPSLQNKKNEENERKVKVDNYRYKEIKVKGPENYKPVMKLRIGINGEKFYEKFVPEKKVIKYTYEPICKIINSSNMNNVAFKKIVSNYHSGIRKKYKKIDPKLLIEPAATVIITNNSFSYKGNVIENINNSDNIINNKNDDLKNENNDKIIDKDKNINQRKNI